MLTNDQLHELEVLSHSTDSRDVRRFVNLRARMFDKLLEGCRLANRCCDVAGPGVVACAVEQEREVCLKIIERHLVKRDQCAVGWHEIQDCINEIRARGKQEFANESH